MLFTFGNQKTVFAKSFTDVNIRNSHYQGVMYWAKYGVINGYKLKNGEQEFRPNEKLRRDHAAAIINRSLFFGELSDSEIEGILDDIKDIDMSHEYAKDIASLYYYGIFQGNSSYFMAKEPLSRQQMATVIYNRYELDMYMDGTNVDINLHNVDDSHKESVQALANLGITDQTDDFRPSEPVTRGQFATFLYRAEMNENNGGTGWEPPEYPLNPYPNDKNANRELKEFYRSKGLSVGRERDFSFTVFGEYGDYLKLFEYHLHQYTENMVYIRDIGYDETIQFAIEALNSAGINATMDGIYQLRKEMKSGEAMRDGEIYTDHKNLQYGYYVDSYWIQWW